MDLIISNSFQDNEVQLMRKIGYFPFYDRNTKRNSYLRQLTNSQNFPRFHIYLKVQSNKLIINLHLDQKKASYHGYKMHSGEGDSEAVLNELNRLKKILTLNSL